MTCGEKVGGAGRAPCGWVVAAAFTLSVLTACGSATSVGRVSTTTPSGPTVPALANVIPTPRSATPGDGVFALAPDAGIYADPDDPEVLAVGRYLAERLRPATGYGLGVAASSASPVAGSITLTTTDADPALGEEGYVLTIAVGSASLSAFRPAGLFRGVQTMRQLLPPAIESATPQAGPWTMPAGTIRDTPRFAWRGTMLDVARHFFGVADVQRYIDLAAFYKMNRVHLHLSDDQGWRLEIRSWPRLATYGGSSDIDGGPGGYFTQDEYGQLVAYARSRYITLVPEIDMPAHTNAALASYAELNCDGVAPPLHSTGPSALCTSKDITYRFIDDVMRELAGLTPGPYIHIGGDEATTLDATQYVPFVNRVQAIVSAHGKRVVGWEEIAQAQILPTSIAQHWSSDLAQQAVRQGAQVIMSPANKAYLDQKYTPATTLGLAWAGYVEVQDAYEWDPATIEGGVTEPDVLGVEAPLWSETLRSMSDIEYMALPRLAGHAELGWSAATGRSWEEYRVRLAAQGPRLAAMGVNFYRSPQVAWP